MPLIVLYSIRARLTKVVWVSLVRILRQKSEPILRERTHDQKKILVAGGVLVRLARVLPLIQGHGRVRWRIGLAETGS
jgi:hypothetical protein